MSKEKGHSHGGVGSGVLTLAEWKAYIKKQDIIVNKWIEKRRKFKEDEKKFFSQKGPEIRVVKQAGAGIIITFKSVKWKNRGYFTHYRAKGKTGWTRFSGLQKPGKKIVLLTRFLKRCGPSPYEIKIFVSGKYGLIGSKSVFFKP